MSTYLLTFVSQATDILWRWKWRISLENLCAQYIELVFKELNHLAAILHVYARGFDFYEVKKIIIFQK